MCSFHVLILRFPWALLAFTRFGIQNLWKYFKYSTYRMLNRRDQKGRFRYEKYLRVWNYYVAEPHLTTNIWDRGSNDCLKSRMREIRKYGSMKGSRQALRSSRTHSAGLHGLWSLHKIWGGLHTSSGSLIQCALASLMGNSDELRCVSRF